MAPTGEIHEDSSHQLRGQAEELGAILPLDLTDIDQPEIRLINQSRGLQRMTGTLSRHVSPCGPVQFPIDQWKQLLQSSVISIAPRQQ
jgi:hypothetical protein